MDYLVDLTGPLVEGALWTGAADGPVPAFSFHWEVWGRQTPGGVALMGLDEDPLSPAVIEESQVAGFPRLAANLPRVEDPDVQEGLVEGLLIKVSAALANPNSRAQGEAPPRVAFITPSSYGTRELLALRRGALRRRREMRLGGIFSEGLCLAAYLGTTWLEDLDRKGSVLVAAYSDYLAAGGFSLVCSFYREDRGWRVVPWGAWRSPAPASLPEFPAQAVVAAAVRGPRFSRKEMKNLLKAPVQHIRHLDQELSPRLAGARQLMRWNREEPGAGPWFRWDPQWVVGLSGGGSHFFPLVRTGDETRGQGGFVLKRPVNHGERLPLAARLGSLGRHPEVRLGWLTLPREIASHRQAKTFQIGLQVAASGAGEALLVGREEGGAARVLDRLDFSLPPAAC